MLPSFVTPRDLLVMLARELSIALVHMATPTVNAVARFAMEQAVRWASWI